MLLAETQMCNSGPRSEVKRESVKARSDFQFWGDRNTANFDETIIILLQYYYYEQRRDRNRTTKCIL
tara:strand:- start:167 stop:367 length:201 start_codon:yes stop_codon:yes gene_type:complete